MPLRRSTEVIQDRGFAMKLILLVAVTLVIAGCSKKQEPSANQAANAAAQQAAGTAQPIVPGFDPAKAPIAPEPSLGEFPYFSLIDGYQEMTYESSHGDPHFHGNVRDAKFDRFEFFDGYKMIPVEGRLNTMYAEGQGASFYEVQKTYERMIKNLGGVTVFEGTGKDIHDKNIQYKEVRHRERLPIEEDKIGVYMVRTPSREIWVEVWQPRYVDTNYFLTVVEKQTLKPRASLLSASEMKSALDAQGHVAIPVLFDTDKTDIKPESAPLIAEVVELLKDNPSLKLRIEGHTDNVAGDAYNMTLSDGRSKSVLLALLKAGIDEKRLQAMGFGESKPVADNATDEGRAKNRRVELVKI